MAMGVSLTHVAAPDATDTRPVRRRRFLLTVTVCAGALGAAIGTSTAPAMVEPDLVRLLQFMALLKSVFALIAFGACYWRLARPAMPWREVVYAAGPGLMIGGALCLWQLRSAGVAAAGLHIGMFALLAAALTDQAFIPQLRRRRT